MVAAQEFSPQSWFIGSTELVKNVLPSWLCPLATHSEEISVVISDLPECLVLTLAEFMPALLHSFSLIFLGLIAF